MTDERWLNPFADTPLLKAAAPEPLLPPLPARTPKERAEGCARVEAKIAEVLALFKRTSAKAAGAADPEAPLMTLFAAHEVAVAEAAAAARQTLASRQAAWRMGRALDGRPIG